MAHGGKTPRDDSGHVRDVDEVFESADARMDFLNQRIREVLVGATPTIDDVILVYKLAQNQYVHETKPAGTGASNDIDKTFSRKGNVGNNKYLLSDGDIPSNQAGHVLNVGGTSITVSVSAKDNATGDIELFERVGAAFNSLLTISLAAIRKKTQTFSVTTAQGDEIAAKVTSGSFKEPVLSFRIH